MTMVLVAKERCYDTPAWAFVCAAIAPGALSWATLAHPGPALLDMSLAPRFLVVSILFGAAVALAPTRRFDAGFCGALLGALGAGAAFLPSANWPISPASVLLADVAMSVVALAWFTSRTKLFIWKKVGLWVAICGAIGAYLLAQLN